MALLEVQLLGRPQLLLGGEPLPGPRGHKAWGLLARLACGRRAPSRDELVELLLPDADDPLRALRWNLSALRRALPGAELGGDPVRLALPAGARLDLEVLTGRGWREALALPGLGRDLLEGLRFGASPAFELWLEAERRHLRATAEAVLREAALAQLAAGEPGAAADLAARLVASDPYDESAQALLVRSLAAAGDGVGAARQVARCRELFRRDLGAEPSPALAAAATVLAASPTVAPVSGRAAAAAQLEAGQAAIEAGALDAGLQCLRRAVDDARRAGDGPLEAQALVALGAALVHAARGRDEEAAAALHRALGLARGATAAAAARELGYVEFLRARYGRAKAWLTQAAPLAEGDPAEQARVATVLGSVLSDQGRYGAARERLDAALALAREAGDGRQAAYVLSMLGRAALLQGDLDVAAAELDASLEAARDARWASFTPWPGALRAEVDLLRGRPDAAARRLEHAFALGCQLGDPCWEGLSARGLGLVAAAHGEVDAARAWLGDARRRCSRLPDAYLWVEAHTLDALCTLEVAAAPEAAAGTVEALAALAARGGMRDHEARALAHRARLGDPSALTAARTVAREVDSPALHALLAGASPAVA